MFQIQVIWEAQSSCTWGHALSAAAGPWEKVTENEKTLGALDCGHDVHLGFGPTLEECCGPSEDGPVYCICNSLQGPGGYWFDECWVIQSSCLGQQGTRLGAGRILQCCSQCCVRPQAPAHVVRPASVSVLDRGSAECLFIRKGKWADLGTALQTGFHAAGQPLQQELTPYKWDYCFQLLTGVMSQIKESSTEGMRNLVLLPPVSLLHFSALLASHL